MKDLFSNTKGVYIETRRSSKNNKDYSVLVTEFKNGYKNESFLNNEQMFILNSLPSAGNH